MRRSAVMGFVLGVTFAVAPSAAAEDRLDALAAAVNRATATPQAERAALETLARLVSAAPQSLRAEKAASGLGWGDLFIAHRIAARGGHPIEKVIAARRTGARWSQIAEEARVEDGALIRDVTSAWPESARAVPEPARGAGEPAARPPSATPAPVKEPSPVLAEPEPKRNRIFDFFRRRGAAAPKAEPKDDASQPPPDPVQEEIRDKFLRGGGRRGW